MVNRILFCVFLLISVEVSISKAYAQIGEYNTLVGVTAGTSIGASVKQFVSQAGAAELLIYRRWKGWVGTVLFEHHIKIREFRDLEWYVGGGAHYGFWKDGKGEPPWVYKIDKNYRTYGIDAILGIEYNINQSNFYCGAFWKPAYNFTSFTGFWGDEVSATLKYSF